MICGWLCSNVTVEEALKKRFLRDLSVKDDEGSFLSYALEWSIVVGSLKSMMRHIDRSKKLMKVQKQLLLESSLSLLGKATICGILVSGAPWRMREGGMSCHYFMMS